MLPVEGQELSGCWCWVGWTPRVHVRTEVGAQVIPGSLQGLCVQEPRVQGRVWTSHLIEECPLEPAATLDARDGGCGMRLEEERRRAGALEGRCIFTIFIVAIVSWYVQECSIVSDSLRPPGLWPTRLLCPCNSSCKNTGVGSHFFSRGSS